jgi:hypothetical protein
LSGEKKASRISVCTMLPAEQGNNTEKAHGVEATASRKKSARVVGTGKTVTRQFFSPFDITLTVTGQDIFFIMRTCTAAFSRVEFDLQLKGKELCDGSTESETTWSCNGSWSSIAPAVACSGPGEDTLIESLSTCGSPDIPERIVADCTLAAAAAAAATAAAAAAEGSSFTLNALELSRVGIVRTSGEFQA